MEKAGNLLNHLLGSALSREAEKYSSFFHFFNDILGEQLARQVHIRDIEKNVVIAEASHPGWIQTFGLKKAEFLTRISSRYPELKIRDIHVKLAGRGKGPGLQKGAGSERSQNGSREKEKIVSAMEHLSDDQQGKVVKQLFGQVKHRRPPV